jgi:hypothetical protein
MHGPLARLTSFAGTPSSLMRVLAPSLSFSPTLVDSLPDSSLWTIKDYSLPYPTLPYLPILASLSRLSRRMAQLELLATVLLKTSSARTSVFTILDAYLHPRIGRRPGRPGNHGAYSELAAGLLGTLSELCRSLTSSAPGQPFLRAVLKLAVTVYRH